MFDVLFFSAHPDDAEFAAGGTLIKLSRHLKVLNVILTHGEAGTFGDPKVREEEAQCAARKGGFECRFLDIRDNFVEDDAENAHRLAQIIREARPKIVLAPYHTNPTYHHDGLSHPDHLALGSLVRKAVRFAKFKNARLEGKPHCASRIVYYMVPRHARPSFVVDVSDVLEEMKELWRCHQSQLSIDNGRLMDRLLVIRQSAGMLNRLDYAESFLMEEPLVIGPEAFAGLI